MAVSSGLYTALELLRSVTLKDASSLMRPIGVAVMLLRLRLGSNGLGMTCSSCTGLGFRRTAAAGGRELDCWLCPGFPSSPVVPCVLLATSGAGTAGPGSAGTVVVVGGALVVVCSCWISVRVGALEGGSNSGCTRVEPSAERLSALWTPSVSQSAVLLVAFTGVLATGTGTGWTGWMSGCWAGGVCLYTMEMSIPTAGVPGVSGFAGCAGSGLPPPIAELEICGSKEVAGRIVGGFCVSGMVIGVVPLCCGEL